MYFCADVDDAASGGAELINKMLGGRQNDKSPAKLEFERRHRDAEAEYAEVLRTDPMSVRGML